MFKTDQTIIIPIRCGPDYCACVNSSRELEIKLASIMMIDVLRLVHKVDQMGRATSKGNEVKSKMKQPSDMSMSRPLI